MNSHADFLRLKGDLARTALGIALLTAVLAAGIALRALIFAVAP